ncbi:MAG: c-type cytochrome [Anaerolineae bacterium]
MKKLVVLSLTLIVVGSLLVVAVASAQAGSVSRGGRLYDKWWAELGVDAPTTDHPLWATQSTNTRSGSATWRCKECHGWDYLGKDGVYGSGSHMTGFPGVFDAAQSKSTDDLIAALKGATNSDHDFSSVLDDQAMLDLATFMKVGILDDREYIDYAAKAPKNADKEHGKEHFNGLCAACHGPDGTNINFGSEEEPEYVGTVASENPQEFLHKDRFGQPGSEPAMPSTFDLGWDVQEVLDVMAYAQTMPTGEEGAVVSQGSAVSRGGRLYDKWWAELGVDAPTTDHPLWATQSTNTRSGKDTWRCKECHGWDYQGKDGAYGSGSHMTGFTGVFDAAQSKSKDDLAAALKGATNADHDFSSLLGDAAIDDLATFLKEGLIDDRDVIDYASKAPKSGDKEHGKEHYNGLCAACHGPDGTNINFGSEEEPEYVGTVASENPQEFLHKDRFGQPGSEPAMPSTFDLGWSLQEVLDVMAYAQTMPTGEEVPAALPKTGAEQLAWNFPVLVAGLLAMMLGLALALTAVTMRRRAHP